MPAHIEIEDEYSIAALNKALNDTNMITKAISGLDEIPDHEIKGQIKDQEPVSQIFGIVLEKDTEIAKAVSKVWAADLGGSRRNDDMAVGKA